MFKSIDRSSHLLHLANLYEVPLSVVQFIADQLGPEEDFDALITFVSSYSDSIELND